MALVQCESGDPDCLWKIVQECVKAPPGGCAYVDKSQKFAVLKDKKGSAHYLTLPTDKVTGIEDPAVTQPGFPNYWYTAWDEAGRYLKKPREQMGLAINSVKGRDQRQMHLHMACVRSDVAAALEKQRSQVKKSWAPKPFLALRGHSYNGRWLDKDALKSNNPFQLLLELEGAAHHMDLQSLAVIGSKDGFYVLDDYTDGTHPGHAEELLDEDCTAGTHGHE